MLDKEKDIDAVIIATPDHSHAVIAMAAMAAQEHVYVQKPLTHSVYEARLLTEAARKQRVATQMGNQGHSGEGVRLLCEWIWDGAIGEVREVHAWTNRPVWPQGIEVDRPTETPPVPAGLDWDLWLGPARHRPYHPTYHPEVARLVGFRDRLARRHGLPYPRPALLGAQAQIPGQRGGRHLDLLARILGGDQAEERVLPPLHDRPLPVPGARGHARGRPHLVGRRADAAAARRARAGGRMGDADGGILFIGDKGP